MAIERIPITNRADWLALRRQDITASDVALVCGEGAYGSLAELYADKKGLRPPLTDNPVLRRGRWDEPAVFEALAEERPDWELRRAKVYLRDPDLRLGCTPDGFALAPDRDGIGVVQAKSVNRYIFRQRWLDDPEDPVEYGDATPPSHFRLQTLTEQMLADTKWGVLAVIISGEYGAHFRMFNIERDEETEALIRNKVEAFWREHLDPGIMPAFEPQRDAELIKRLFPADSGTTIDLTLDNRAAQLTEDLVQVLAEKKRLKDDEEKIKAELQAKLGTNTYGLLYDGRCLSWKRHHRRGYAVPPSDPRVLRVLKQKPAEKNNDDD